MKKFDNQYLLCRATDDMNAHLENMGSAGYRLVSATWDQTTESHDLFFTKELEEAPTKKEPLVADPSTRSAQPQSMWRIPRWMLR